MNATINSYNHVMKYDNMRKTPTLIEEVEKAPKSLLK